MSDSSVLSLLVWATLLPLIVVLVLRTSKRDDDEDEAAEDAPSGEADAVSADHDDAAKPPQ